MSFTLLNKNNLYNPINPAYKSIFSFPHALTPLSSHEFILKKQMCCDKHK